VVLAAVASNDNLAARGGGALIIMGMWWVTELLPLEVTSLLPMPLYTFLGITKAGTLAGKFFNGTSFLFCAGFLIGIAVERWGVHKRIAYTLVARTGKRVELLIGGFIFAVWMLSMWISNTATVLCMLPVAQAFLDSLQEEDRKSFEAPFLVSLSWAASIGGIATPVGTPTNGIFLGIYEKFWGEQFPFLRFVLAVVPLSFFLILTVWLGVCACYIWIPKRHIPIDVEAIHAARDALGPWRFEEMVVVANLGILVLLWFTASPIGSFRGWKVSVSELVDDGCIGLAMTLPLFFIPCATQLPRWLLSAFNPVRCTSRTEDSKDDTPLRILDWKYAKPRFKWDVLFVFGGAYMVAEGTVKSGFADLVADEMSQWNMSEPAYLLLIVTMIAFITEFISNMACVSIFGPIFLQTGDRAFVFRFCHDIFKSCLLSSLTLLYSRSAWL
jgi:sodium-dependent dicarboxylate transporter 2/3/5